MIIYKDLITGCELLTDAYKIEDNDGVFKVKGKLVTEKDDIQLAGANPSAEEGGDDYEDGSTTGVDVVLANKLVACNMDKKGYISVFKTYVKKVESILKEKNPDRVDAFKKEVSNFFKDTVIGKWKEMKWEFYQGFPYRKYAAIWITVDFSSNGETSGGRECRFSSKCIK